MADGPSSPAPPVLDLALEGLSLGGSPILGDIALQVAPAETVALVGPSGIGKSTLLRIFAGLQTGYRGRCIVRGRAAIVFQEPALLPWRTLRDNITIPTGVSDERARASLAEVGLEARADAFPLQLSLGQQRRLALARAFAVAPDLMLLDEPFVSLDPALVDEMMTLFRDLRARHRIATILVTHVRSEAEALADRVVTLGGPPARIVSDTRT